MTRLKCGGIEIPTATEYLILLTADILSLLMIISTAEFPKVIMTGCAARDLKTRSTVNATNNQPER